MPTPRVTLLASVFVLTTGLSACCGSPPTSTSSGSGGAAPATTPAAGSEPAAPEQPAEPTVEEDAGTGTDSSTTGTKPAAPTLTSVNKETKGSGNGVTVTWTTTETALTGFEIWRNADDGAFSKVATPAGTATSTFDATATGMYTYCWKMKALRGAVASDFSTPKCFMTGM